MANLREQQLQFANHLRNPELFPAPEGVDERRLQVYRDLFFNNMVQLLASTFPVVRSILDDVKWRGLVRDFYTLHRCETPLFPWIAGEFVDYLFNERDNSSDFPFLQELAHYEWSEIALRHEADCAVEIARVGDKPVLSPLCWMLSYHYPVHRIGKDFLPQQASELPTCLLMYRNQEDDVKFIESNPATFRLLQLLMDDELKSVEAVADKLACEMQQADQQALLLMTKNTLAQLEALGVLLK
ncbi:MAG TPA: putative DNA-binding domain-containing protein [Pseudomonadales bacterium]|nr:putative DNA-binding domain-containing protein [Pseudomonadales bacterium]HNL92003.1 putative DNA-binding domain-containing protein [Pseudomonadales bacterium]